MRQAAPKSLYDRLGGAAAVSEAVQKMYVQMTVDPLLSPFFPSDKIELIKKHQVAFFTLAFGGPNYYTGRRLREAHAPLLQMGLSDIHFDAVVFYLVETLKEMKVENDLILEVSQIIEGYRNDVLGR